MMSGWETKTLVEVCEIKPPKSEARERVPAKALVSFAPMEDLGIDRKFLNVSQVKPMDSIIGSYTYFAEGDVLLAKITPCFENGKLGIAAGLTNGIGFGSSEFIVFRPGVKLDRAFLYYYLSRPDFRNEGAARMGGAVGQQRVPREFIESYPIPLPPLAEQQRIVGLLDEAFAGLATAKTNAEKNLRNARALFESHLQSVFTQRGAEWDRVTLETLLERGWIEGHLDGNHGSDYPRKEEFISGGVPYISANCMDDEGVDMSRAKYLSPSRAAMLRKGIARDNDVLFAHNATVGPVAILHTDEEKVILGTSLTYYRCNPDHILPEYLAHYMRSFGFKKQYLQVMGQSTRNQVPITKQREFFHVIPPIEEQMHITTALDGLFENGQRLATLYTRKLAVLDALKKSLLHQAFTGGLTKDWRQPKIMAFPRIVEGITTTDLHAGLLAMAYRCHETHGKQSGFGHVKGEKIIHLMEAFVGLELGRTPVKDAAGPNDFPHLQKVEHRARRADFFNFKRSDGSGAYCVTKLPKFDELVQRTEQALGERKAEVGRLLDLTVKLDRRQAEIVATVFAAWNNLLLAGEPISDERIVMEARENWHPDKLNIKREKFFKAIVWMKEKGIVPVGRGKKVGPRTV